MWYLGQEDCLPLEIETFKMLWKRANFRFLNIFFLQQLRWTCVHFILGPAWFKGGNFSNLSINQSCSPFTHGHTDRVTNEATLSGFQVVSLQSSIKDRPNILIGRPLWINSEKRHNVYAGHARSPIKYNHCLLLTYDDVWDEFSSWSGSWHQLMPSQHTSSNW